MIENSTISLKTLNPNVSLVSERVQCSTHIISVDPMTKQCPGFARGTMGYHGDSTELQLTEQLMRRLASVETFYAATELSAGEGALPHGGLLLNEQIGLEYGAQYLRSDVEGANPRGVIYCISYVHMAKINLMNQTQAELLRFEEDGLQQPV
jgi:hypothetical protein